MSDRKRYSDEELQEFKQLILAKLEKASLEYDRLRDNLTNLDGNDIACFLSHGLFLLVNFYTFSTVTYSL